MKRALVVVAIAIAVATTTACSRSEPRPAGITERWLQAVSELGREGLRADAEERAAEYGSPEATAKVRPADAEEDERTFSDLEVGKAVVDIDQARVPFRLTARIEGGERRESDGAAVLVKEEGTWRVIDVVPREPTEKVPSEGGERPARAGISHWLYAVLASAVATLIGVGLIEREGRRHASN